MVLRKLARAHEHMHPACGLRKKHRGLSGGISSAHHDHVLIFAQLRLHIGRAVIDALSLESLQVRMRGLLYCAPVAMTIARAASALPPSSTTPYGRSAQSSRATLCAQSSSWRRTSAPG